MNEQAVRERVLDAIGDYAIAIALDNAPDSHTREQQAEVERALDAYRTAVVAAMPCWREQWYCPNDQVDWIRISGIRCDAIGNAVVCTSCEARTGSTRGGGG